MTAKERIRMIALEVQALEETIEHYKPFYVRKAYAKEGIKRSVKQVRAHLLALVDDLDAMEDNAADCKASQIGGRTVCREATARDTRCGVTAWRCRVYCM